MLRPLVSFFIFVLILRANILHGADQRARLDLRVNDTKKGQITVIIRGSDILVQLSDLESAGIAVRAGNRETINGARYVSLQSLKPLVLFKVNDLDLSLRLSTKLEASASATNALSARGTQQLEQSQIGAESDPTTGRDLQVILGFKVNGVRKAPITVILRGDDILAPLKDLGELPPSPSVREELSRGERFVSLKSLSPSVTFRLDEKALELGLTVESKESQPKMAEVQAELFIVDLEG